MNFVLNSLIVHTLKKYIQNFENFQLSLFQGEICLSKISLIQKSLNQFIAGFTENLRIYKGNISKFKLIIPWSSLTSKSILMTASELQINLHFSHFDQLLQAEKVFFGIKEEIKYGVCPEVDESLIKKFLNKVINNLRINMEKILIIIDLDVYILQISVNELEVYNCKEQGSDYEYIQSKKIVSKMIILRELRIKIMLKTGKELDIIKFDNLQIKIFIKNEQYSFLITNYNDSVITLDLSILKFFFEKIPDFFFKEKLKPQQQPITFLLYNNIEMLKNSFQLKYHLEKLKINILNNFEEEFMSINQCINTTNFQMEFISSVAIQKYLLNFEKIEFSSKGNLFLSLNNNENGGQMWKFAKLNETSNFEDNLSFDVMEKKQENNNSYQYDFQLVFSQINYFLEAAHFLNNLKEILQVYQSFMNDLYSFLTKIQEKKQFQKRNSKIIDFIEEEKIDTLSFSPKIIYNYTIKFIRNRIELSDNYSKILENAKSSSNYYIYFSIFASFKGVLSRKSGLIKKFNFQIKPQQLKIEDINQIKNLEIINSEIIYEKFEKNARISNLKIVICELSLRTLQSTLNDFYSIFQKINGFFFSFSEEKIEKNKEKSTSLIDKDYQFNIQLKIMNFNLSLGEIIYIDLNDPIPATFKEIFDLKFSKIEIFSMENVSVKESPQPIPTTNYKNFKLNFKFEIFFINPLFFEVQCVLNKVNVQLFFDFLDSSKNKLEFLNSIQVSVDPEILSNLYLMLSLDNNKPISLVKYIKNETNNILYLKFHHFIKNEELITLNPGQQTVLMLSNKKFDSHLNFYQIGRKFHEDDEIPFYSDKFFILYDENKSIGNFSKKITISGLLQHEECVLHLKTLNLRKSISNEVLTIFADLYLINLLSSQKLNLLFGFNKTNDSSKNEKNEMEQQSCWEIKAKILKNSRENQDLLENLLKSNNKLLKLESLVENKLFENQYNYHTSIEDFLDTSNEYLMSNLCEHNKQKFFHIFFKKNSNFKFLTYKLYSKIENDNNSGKNLFYVDIFQKDGINFSIIKPFILISNKIDKVINLSLREYLTKDERINEMDQYEIQPESFYSLCSSLASNIFCTKLLFEFRIFYHNLNFQGQKIVFKTYNEDQLADDRHILQFSNESSFAFDVILFNKKIEETSILEFDFPLEIINESDYVIIIKIKKSIDPIIIQPSEKCKVLKHLNPNCDSLHFSILQKGDLMFSNANAIEVTFNDLMNDKIKLLSFNFTKLNEDFLNIFLNISLSSENGKQKLLLKSFLQIANKTDNFFVLSDSNKIIKPQESCSLEFKFSCDEEYNNKLIKVGVEYIKTFCQNLIRNKFLSASPQTPEKIIKIGLMSMKSDEVKQLVINEMIINNQCEVKFQKESFMIGLYRNFSFNTNQLILYLVKNVIHDNRNYILLSNQTPNLISFKPYYSLTEEKKKDFVSPNSSSLMFYDDKVHQKHFKVIEGNNDQNLFTVNSIAMQCLKYFMIRNKNSDNIYFQIIIPSLMVKFFLDVDNEINLDLEIHFRIFQSDKFDILLNKFKIEKNSKNNSYSIVSAQSPPYIIMERNYFPQKNIMIFKNVYLKVDKLKFIIRNDTIAFLFKFFDQFYAMMGFIKKEETEKQNFQNINLDLLTFIYNLKIEEYKINLNISLEPHLLLNDFNVSIPVFKINNQKSFLKNVFNEIISFYLAHFVVQLPKTSITLNQLKNPFNLVTLLWNYKEKFMKSSLNFERINPIQDSIQSISNIRFQMKYAKDFQEQLFLILNSKNNSQSNSMKHLVITNQFLYIISQGRIYKHISLKDIKKIKWCYSSKVINVSSNNSKDLELLTTLRNGYRLVNVMKEILI